jgi:diguanylate cyclase (GGDEF)-like protein/PAS domain S-box-containing protein
MATILVVDDRVVNRQFLATLFAYAGHQVVEAADGAEALERAGQSPVDLVFSDILMPAMDGVEMARRMRADASLAHIPVIFYTATYRSTDARKLAAECGVQDVLAKPSEPGVILDVVSKYVGAGIRPVPQTSAADIPMPSGQVMERLTGYIGDLSQLQGRLTEVIEHGQQLIGRGGDLRELSYSLSDAFSTLQTISLRLSAVIELGLELASERDPKQLVELCCRGAQDILSAQRAAIGILRNDGSGLEYLSVPGFGGWVPAALSTLLPASGVLGEVVASGSARKIPAAGAEPARLVVPVRSPQRIYGWAWFEGRLGARGFSEEDEHFAVTLAAQLGLGYENLLLYHEKQRHATALQSEVAERTRAQESLAESEERFRQIAENIRDVFYLVDVQTGRTCYVSPAYQQIWGRSCESAYTHPESWLEAIHPDDRTDIQDRWLRDRSRGVFQYSYRIVRPDGSIRSIEARGFPVHDAAGTVYRLAGVATDMTERLQLQSALQERDAGLRRAQLMARLAHVVSASDGSFESWSETLPHLIGMQAPQMPKAARDWMKLVHPEDQSRVRRQILKSRIERKRIELQYNLRRPDGRSICISHVAEPLGEEAGPTGGARWFNTFQDVTAQRLAESKIRRLNRVYAVRSRINSLIIRVKDRGVLFQQACRIIVKSGQFSLAWIALVDRERTQLTPVAWYGPAQGFVALVRGRLSLLEPAKKQSLTARAATKKLALVCNDVRTDARIKFTREHEQFGTRSVGAFPLIVEDVAIGVLVLHAAEVGFFDSAEMRLLLELADDIAFALHHIGKVEQVDYLAYYDSLTGLANRTLLHERLVVYLKGAGSEHLKFAVVILDVARLGTINETLGWRVGDALLKQVAERMRHQVRDPNQLARIGSDQFVVLLPGIKTAEELAHNVHSWVTELFVEPFRSGEMDLQISVRGGIALFPEDGDNADMLLRHADAALHKAKQTGERQVFYAREMTKLVSDTLTLENKLRQAVHRAELALYYQPKVDLETRSIVGLEALLRWQSPDLGLVPALKFIPLLEETGLILEVGAWVWRRAALDHRAWAEQGPQAPRIAVNVSAIQLRQRDFLRVVHEAIAVGVTPTGIDLEITESLIMEDVEASIEKLKAVRELGMNIAIDDFGTGYSSLAYLAALPLAILKIDRVFVAKLPHDPTATTIVKTIITMAHSLRLKVVAEGVETEEQAKLLQLLRCDQMQGYLISKAVPKEEITALLRAGASGRTCAPRSGASRD